jgi:hypothetical protein
MTSRADEAPRPSDADSPQPAEQPEALSVTEPLASTSASPETVRRLRLELADPSDGVAGEDRPESWGDAASDERRRMSEYEENRPPHHL